MLFIIRLIWGHIQSDCTIARYQISIKLNYCEIEFSPRAQESLAVHPFTFCLLPSWDRWKSVCPGEQWHVHHQVWEPRHNASPPPLPSEDWAAVPIPGAQWLSTDESALPADRLSKFRLWTKKSAGRLGPPLCSIYCTSQRLELAQNWLTENSFSVQ